MVTMAAAGTIRRMRGLGSVGQAWLGRRHAQDGTESFVQMYLRTRPALFGNSLKGLRVEGRVVGNRPNTFEVDLGLKLNAHFERAALSTRPKRSQTPEGKPVFARLRDPELSLHALGDPRDSSGLCAAADFERLPMGRLTQGSSGNRALPGTVNINRSEPQAAATEATRASAPEEELSEDITGAASNSSEEALRRLFVKSL